MKRIRCKMAIGKISKNKIVDVFVKKNIRKEYFKLTVEKVYFALSNRRQSN